MIHRYARRGGSVAFCRICETIVFQFVTYERLDDRLVLYKADHCHPCAQQAHPVLWKKFVVSDVKQRMIS